MKPLDRCASYSPLLTKEEAISLSKQKNPQLDGHITRNALKRILTNNERKITQTRYGYVVSSVFPMMYVYIHVHSNKKRVTYESD